MIRFVCYTNDKMWNEILFTRSSTYETPLIRPLDNGRHLVYFIALMHVHKRGIGNIRLLKYICEFTEVGHSER